MLPPAETPLNQHSLIALESWLRELGAEKSSSDPCVWNLLLSEWSAQIKLEQDELRVTWDQDESKRQCCFSYGLSRRDVEAAMNEGP